jgi:hypothetical protein
MKRHGLPLPAYVAASIGLHFAVVVVAVLPHRPRADVLVDEAPPRQGALVGDSFEVPLEVPLVPLDLDDPETDPGDPEPAAAPAIAPAPSPEPGVGDPARRPARSARPAKSGARPPPPPTVYGAVGERGSVDLATAFTRGFPQASCADPAWQTVPFGPAGAVDVTLAIDGAGNLVDVRVSGGSAALVRSVHRTGALLHARSFTAARPTTHLHVVATVSQDQVHDGLHGDVFAIGGSFAGTEGSGFFALAVGRRIDVRVTEVRVTEP